MPMIPLMAADAPRFLPEAVALLAAAALIAYICSRLGIVPIAGFLLAGVAIGPHALGVVEDIELVEAAAELGVVLLLFTIGIEFRLEQLARIRRAVFGSGGLQVGLTILVVTLALMLFGVSWRDAVFTGCLVALSSTAIVLKLLSDRRATTNPLGQQALGVLIFQDLAVVAMVLLLPMIGGEAETSTWEMTQALLMAVGIIMLVLVLARRFVPPLLEAVARTCSPEIFLLTLISLCFGTAWLTSLAGVSLALGAFLAGLVVSESRFSHHALGEIMPLQILFSATFFVSIGMLLDLQFLLDNLPLVVLAVVVVVVLKAVVTTLSLRLLRLPVATALGAGLLLAQVGEFSFVLQQTGAEAGLSPAGLAERGAPTFVAASVVLLLATPLLASGGFQLERRLRPNDDAGTTSPAAGADGQLRDHVIIDGWGPAGQAVARALQDTETPFVVITRNPDGAIEAETASMRVFRGSTSRLPTLQEASIYEASVLLVADDDPETTERVVAIAREANDDIRIIARIEEPEHDAALRAAGADVVIAFNDAVSETEVERQLLPRILNGLSRNGASDGDARGPRRSTVTDSTNVLCTHLDQIREVTPGTPDGCEECLKTGDRWVHLRLCLNCGHVGCCDSSPNRHASKHAMEHGHPVVESFEPGEDWRWCYVDEVYV